MKLYQYSFNINNYYVNGYSILGLHRIIFVYFVVVIHDQTPCMQKTARWMKWELLRIWYTRPARCPFTRRGEEIDRNAEYNRTSSKIGRRDYPSTGGHGAEGAPHYPPGSAQDPIWILIYEPRARPLSLVVSVMFIFPSVRVQRRIEWYPSNQSDASVVWLNPSIW